MNRRTAWILVCSYALLALGWAVIARFAIPTWIEEVWHSPELASVNRMLVGEARTLEEYRGEWERRFQVVPLVFICHFLLLLLLWRGTESDLPAPRLDLFLAVFAFVFLVFTALSGGHEDYVDGYLLEWKPVPEGGDPYFLRDGKVLNAYGPLFNSLGLLAWWRPYAPKMLFAFVGLWVMLPLFRAEATRQPHGLGWWVFVAFFSSYFWIELGYYGHFDVLVGAACLGAVVCRERDQDSPSGLCVGCGFLLKFFPAVILPFLALEGWRIRYRLLASATVVMVGGMALGYTLWGGSIWRPFTLAGERESLLSIFSFLRSPYSPLRLVVDEPDLDRFSVPCLAVAGLTVFAVWLWRRTGPAVGALIALLTTLLFYKVNYPNYPMALIVPLLYWLVQGPPELARERKLTLIVAAYLAWVAVLAILFLPLDNWRLMVAPQRVEDWILIHPDRDPQRDYYTDLYLYLGGLPTFVLGCALLVQLFRVAGKASRGA